MRVVTGSGRTLTLESDPGKRLGEGGEGTVYAVSGDPSLAVKIYKPKFAASRPPKISAMVQAGLGKTHPQVAFPSDTVKDTSGRFQGFVMPRVAGARVIHQLWQSSDRTQYFPDATAAFMVHASLNVAYAISEIHDSGCVIGDINESGILIDSQTAIANFIDADSFQFRYNGKIFQCEVGSDNFTPPELIGVNLRTVTERTRTHDEFGLAVLIFRLLMDGFMPFSGVWNGAGREPSPQDSIKQHLYAYSSSPQIRSKVKPPRAAPDIAWVGPEIRSAFEQAFGSTGRQRRPSAKDWIGLLDQFQARLVECRRNDKHVVLPGASCEWCDYQRKIGKPVFGAYTKPSSKIAGSGGQNPFGQGGGAGPMQGPMPVPVPPVPPNPSLPWPWLAGGFAAILALAAIKTSRDAAEMQASETVRENQIPVEATPEPLPDFQITSATLGQSIQDGKLLGQVSDWRLKGVPANFVVKWDFSGGRIGTEVDCILQQGDGSPKRTGGISIQHINGGGTCDHSIEEPGFYMLSAQLGGQTVWSHYLYVERSEEQTAAAEGAEGLADGRSASGNSDMNSGWALGQANRPVPADMASGRNRSPAKVGVEAAPATSLFQGRWSGVGYDEGVNWDIVFNLNDDVEVGQPAGESFYKPSRNSNFRFRSDFGTVECQYRFYLVEKKENLLVLREEYEGPRVCVISPGGKDITISANGQNISVTWVKRNKRRKTTMTAELTR